MHRYTCVYVCVDRTHLVPINNASSTQAAHDRFMTANLYIHSYLRVSRTFRDVGAFVELGEQLSPSRAVVAAALLRC